MTISILRTADAWWVHTPTGAARSTPMRPPRASCWPTGRPSTPRRRQRNRAGGQPRPALAGHRAVPRGRADDQLRLPRQGRRHGPEDNPTDVLPQGVGLDQRPLDDIVRPAHVRFLDYEVEIGLVIGREIPVGTVITDDTIADYVAGLVVTNDVSARDVQLPEDPVLRVQVLPDLHPGRAGAGAPRRRRAEPLRRAAAAAVGQRRAPPGHDGRPT